ncbi:MAG TPA: hypothetical protein PKK96_13225, partial [Anaerolineales bacterium]|nr:hypothetical protein [Anaerolineales bacterium]
MYSAQLNTKPQGGLCAPAVQESQENGQDTEPKEGTRKLELSCEIIREYLLSIEDERSVAH